MLHWGGSETSGDGIILSGVTPGRTYCLLEFVRRKRRSSWCHPLHGLVATVPKGLRQDAPQSHDFSQHEVATSRTDEYLHAEGHGGRDGEGYIAGFGE